MRLSTIVERLDGELRTDAYAEIDASANGLQVGPEEAEIERVATAVDTGRATIEAAIEDGADLLVAHHGLLWGGLDRITGREYRLLERLIEEDLALYVSHLPLDGHRELGNAAGVADALGLEDRSPFGSLGDEHVGQTGRLPEPRSADDVREVLDGFERDEPTTVLEFGSDPIETIGIITGSGTDWLSEAIAADLDALLTGEGKQQVYHPAREANVTVFLGGHYATETFGVRAIADLLESWGLETTYLPHPTGL